MGTDYYSSSTDKPKPISKDGKNKKKIESLTLLMGQNQ